VYFGYEQCRPEGIDMYGRSIAASFIAVFALSIGGDLIRPATVEAGGGCHMPDGSVYTEGPATVIRMDVCSFGPTVSRVPIGTTVRFLNTAPNEHIVTGRAGTWGSDRLVPGAEFTRRFAEAGVYPYACPLHPGMVGAVIVGEVVPAAARLTAEESPSAASSVEAAKLPQTDIAPIGAALLAGAVGGGIIGVSTVTFVARRRAGIDADGPRSARHRVHE